jgi:trans-aconitate 2-methyltransferase
MSDWNARQYLKFEDDRTRAARDLLAQVPLAAPRRVVDLGCGPGNSTELLIRRFPAAQVSGVDASPAMLARARARLPACDFIEADIATWQPPADTDLLFANAALQWVPDHLTVIERLLRGLPPGAVVAAQLPDNTQEPSHVLMREVARRAGWGEVYRERLAQVARACADLPSPGVYYDRLRPLCSRLDVWHIVYNHILDGAEAIAEWFAGSGLRPFLDIFADDETGRAAFRAAYVEALAAAYPPRIDGKVLLRFPRLFVVAAK